MLRLDQIMSGLSADLICDQSDVRSPFCPNIKRFIRTIHKCKSMLPSFEIDPDMVAHIVFVRPLDSVSARVPMTVTRDNSACTALRTLFVVVNLFLPAVFGRCLTNLYFQWMHMNTVNC